MEHIVINNTSYGFVSDFKHDRKIRARFNQLTEATFGFSFENWYAAGYWGDNYIPYALLHNDKVVANVSVSKMEFIIHNEKKTGIQIGTVMTAEAHRHRGLSKFLMEQVIKQWKEQCDFLYLFANDSVLDFYPKLDFERVDEYQCSKQLNGSNSPGSLKKLDMDNKHDRDVLEQAISDSIPMAKVSMRNNVPLVMFYCLSFKKDSIFYLDTLKAVVIADFEGDTLHLNDVFSKSAVDLNDVVQLMSGKSTKKVVLGFTPLNEAGFDRSPLREGDTLFVLKEHVDHFIGHFQRFPVLSHA